jgi:hypothetical protein
MWGADSPAFAIHAGGSATAEGRSDLPLIGQRFAAAFLSFELASIGDDFKIHGHSFVRCDGVLSLGASSFQYRIASVRL